MEEEKLIQPLMTLIGNNVRQCRMERGLTQEELANMVEVDPSTIARIKGGSQMMSILNLHAVAEFGPAPQGSSLPRSSLRLVQGWCQAMMKVPGR